MLKNLINCAIHCFILFSVSAQANDNALNQFENHGVDFMKKSIAYFELYTNCINNDLSGSCEIDGKKRNRKYFTVFSSALADMKDFYNNVYLGNKVGLQSTVKSLSEARREYYLSLVDFEYKVAGEKWYSEKNCGDFQKASIHKEDSLYFLQYIMDRLQFEFMSAGSSDESAFYLLKKYELQSSLVAVYRKIEDEREYSSSNICKVYLDYGNYIFDKTHVKFMTDRKYQIDIAASLYTLNYMSAILTLRKENNI